MSQLERLKKEQKELLQRLNNMKKLFLCLFMFGCFDTSIVSKLQLRCSEERPGCQPGFICYIPSSSKDREGMCIDRLTTTDPSADFSDGVLITDLSQPSIDLTTPLDFSVPPSTCSAGGGIHVGNGVYACKGVWTPGNASTLCLNKVCSSITSLQRNNCDGIGGFYVISAGGSVDTSKSMYECLTYSSGGRTPIFYGCGQGGSTAGIVCNGAQSYLPCVTGSSFTCTVDISTISSTSSTRPNTGVLCCP
jgi:hypothetical protein